MWGVGESRWLGRRLEPRRLTAARYCAEREALAEFRLRLVSGRSAVALLSDRVKARDCRYPIARVLDAAAAVDRRSHRDALRVVRCWQSLVLSKTLVVAICPSAAMILAPGLAFFCTHRDHAGMILLRTGFALLAFLALTGCSKSEPVVATLKSPDARKPNIVYILADDLGYNEVGAYGQKKIKTPHLDQLASSGMRFTQHYSGSCVCAPSRCVLLTGKHTGHSLVRGNKEMGGWKRGDPEGQWPLPPETVTLAKLLKDQGYATGAFGKWGLGGPGSTGAPNAQGFDRFYGYLCQRIAHNYYPEHLWSDGEKDVLGNEYFKAHQKIAQAPADAAGWKQYQGDVYAPDRIIEEALAFVKQHKDEPFFLYMPTPVPHVSIQVPDDSLAEYAGAFEETPYLGQKAYLPHEKPRAAYAAMITRMDRDIGSLLKLLDDLKLTDNTIVIFSSDNGPTFNGGTDSKFFDSNKPMSGLKCSLNEGGIRVPMIVRWPGHVQPGSSSDHMSAFEDVLPTLMGIAGGETPAGLDGISFLPSLIGKGEQEQHDYLYWEYPERDGEQALRRGQWKVLRNNLVARNKGKDRSAKLYDLSVDIAEQHDLAASNPEMLAELTALMKIARVQSKVFPLDGLDNE